eukprot:9479198-Pyramimonas_sp.AAC.2
MLTRRHGGQNYQATPTRSGQGPPPCPERVRNLKQAPHAAREAPRRPESGPRREVNPALPTSPRRPFPTRRMTYYQRPKTAQKGPNMARGKYPIITNKRRAPEGPPNPRGTSQRT